MSYRGIMDSYGGDTSGVTEVRDSGERRLMEERAGEGFELDEQLTVVGGKLADRAPDFALDHLNPADQTLSTVHLADSAGSVRLLHVVNLLDTPVCHVGAHRWETLRAELPSDIHVYTVTMDLPYALARWQTAEDVNHQALSAHKSGAFGRDYGVLIKEWRLLQRAVFVIDRADRIAYVENVPDQMQEPHYEAAVEAARRAATISTAVTPLAPR